MTVNFLSTNFPTGDVTDGQYLYRSLGSFWTYVFQDKAALQGYTLGMAEELIQAYYNLMEVVNQYSVKDIDLLHKEKWESLIIKKSEFNNVPFVFEPDSTVFGAQPADDQFYANTLTQFGLPKTPAGKNSFSFTPKTNLKKFGAIANKIIGTSLLLLPGVDILTKNNTLYFNLDLFNSEYIPKTKVIGEYGAPVTFKDSQGNVQEDEFIILWLYQAETDNQSLYKNFGALFELQLPTTESYKDLLKAVMNLAVEGPTVTALSIAFAALAQSPVILEVQETIEDIYTDASYTYVITDKHTYRTALTETLHDAVAIGSTLHAGNVLTDTVELIDSSLAPAWWQQELASDKLGFASHLFAAGVKTQLFFENAVRYITYTDGKLTFPVLGKPEDVRAFDHFINEPDTDKRTGRLSKLLAVLNLQKGQNSEVYINPLDFVFRNLFKNNTLLLKLSFSNTAQLASFFNLLPIIQTYLPPHVYIITYLKLQLMTDDLANLNTGLSIPLLEGQTFSLDGSISISGARPYLPGIDDNYYKDYRNRLFCVSVGPYRNPIFPHYPSPNPSVDDKPLHVYDNLDELLGDSSGFTDGKLRTYIPLTVIPPGQAASRRPSTREVPAILLIDF